jgi:hypothetical protein
MSKRLRATEQKPCGQGPIFVLDGFVPEDTLLEYDRMQEDGRTECESVWLRDGQPPALGQIAKVQLDFDPLWNYLDEEATWVLLAGPVTEVMSPTRVRAIARPSTDNAPPEAECEWELVLRYDRDFDNPWVLESSRRLPPAPP